ncbi:MAG: GerMN domain-containing protein, partial [Armatimonadota bacterium]|nr:GerMN domain-containing protein [Armatimonadota bacterium]
MKTSTLLLLFVVACICIAGSATAGPVAYVDAFGEIYVVNSPRAVDVFSALNQLASPPPGTPFAAGLTSAIPKGTKLLDLKIEGNQATVNFSKRLVARGVTEIAVMTIHDQVKWTLHNWGIDADVLVLAEGVPVTEWLEPTPVIEPRSGVNINSLSGRSITLSPGHGWFWNGSGWYTQRPVYCSPLNEEDFHTLEICQYIQTYLAQDGMTVKMVRCTDKNYGTCSYSGKPWWQMAACYWLKNIGYPCSVYGSYSG